VVVVVVVVAVVVIAVLKSGTVGLADGNRQFFNVDGDLKRTNFIIMSQSLAVLIPMQFRSLLAFIYAFQDQFLLVFA